jgi:FkbM family methyltransferase
LLRLPILARSLRGFWWLPRSRGKILQILGGRYEPEQTAHFVRLVGPGATVIDIGAHAGYYTLLASILAGDSGSVWAFEPDPINARFLRDHMNVNHRRNVHVEELAVSDARGSARFRHGTGSGTGRLDRDGDLDVGTVRLDDFCREHAIRPSALKIDVEGGELAVLDGAAEVIESTRPVIFLSTHSRAGHEECLRRLRALGYTFQPIGAGGIDDAREVLGIPNGSHG